MTFVSVDFETRSTSNLKKEGVYRYAENPTTDVWCMAWVIGDDETVELWTPDQEFPRELQRMVHRRDTIFRAWNAQFERVIWKRILTERYGLPSVPLKRWLCTAAQAARLCLPRALDDAVPAMRLPEAKDAKGYRLMMQMAKPRKIQDDGTIIWWDDSDRRGRLYEYCKQDVRAERGLANAFPGTATWKERDVWLFDQRINDRGILLDRELATTALTLTSKALRSVNREIRELTNGTVPKITQLDKLKDWMAEQGQLVGSLAKIPLKRLLDSELEPMVRQALELRKEGGKSSTTKYKAMLTYACEDDVMRGLFLYHGAGTGRWTGRGPQTQNFIKGEVKVSEELVADIMRGDLRWLNLMYDSPMMALASALRACMRSRPGTEFVVADYNAIEARMVAWLFDSMKLVNLFASGGKVYEAMAETIYGIPMDEVLKDSIERFVAKNTVLGCGFQMGAKTFRLQLREKFGVEISEELAERAVEAFRTDNPEIPDGWKAMNTTALRVVQEGISSWMPVDGTSDRVHFRLHGNFLRMRLPSGRSLWYPEPEIVERKMPWKSKDGKPVWRDAVSFMGVHPKYRKWMRQTLYGGLLTENAVQGMARDLLVEGMFRVEDAGYRVIAHTHDEIMTERAIGEGSLEDMITEMTTLPTWALGCPVAAEGWRGTRYRK